MAGSERNCLGGGREELAGFKAMGRMLNEDFSDEKSRPISRRPNSVTLAQACWPHRACG